MASSFRIFGGELGVPQGYIDADVDGVTLNGDIVLADQNSTDTWSIEPDRIASLADENLLYDLAKVDGGADEWGAIDDVETHYGSDAGPKGHYVEAAKTLFRGASTN